LIQESEGNEDNGHPVVDSNKTNTNDTNQGTQLCPQKNPQRILQILIENFMESILDMVN
jgi:hypothetical protein